MLNHSAITVEPVHYEHLDKCPNHKGALIYNKADEAPLGIIAKQVDYTSALIFRCFDSNHIECSSMNSIKCNGSLHMLTLKLAPTIKLSPIKQ